MYEGVYRTYIKDGFNKKKVDIKTGNYLIATNQPERDLIVLLLEPEGLFSLGRDNIVDIKNKKVPIYRVMGELSLNQKLATTYTKVAKNPSVLNSVIKKLDLDIKTSQLTKLISINSVEDTELIKITAIDKNPVMP